MNAVKTVGRSGQIAIGKEYAGRRVLVHQMEPGVWLVKLGEFVPDSERWLLRAPVADELDEAILWAEEHSPRETDLDELQREGGTQ